jgi:hypothetical protein
MYSPLNFHIYYFDTSLAGMGKCGLKNVTNPLENVTDALQPVQKGAS